MNLFKTSSFLTRTIIQRVEDIEINIHSHYKTKASNFEWFSLALGESTDVTDTVHLFI